MQKIYSRINWENFPSEKTAVNESNLNKMDLAIDNLDDRVVAMDASKVDLTKANELVEAILWDESNGTLTVVKMNGSRAVIDTKLEKLAVNFTYNPQTQQLVITLDDGTVQNVDLSSLITEYEFLDSDTIAFEIVDGKVKAIVKNGSITENHLAPEYLAEIRTQVGRAEMSAKSADASEKNAASSSALAKSYAVGGTGTREGEDTDNAKYYAEQAKNASDVGALSEIVEKHISNKTIHMTESEHGVVSKLGESAEGSLTYNGSEIKPSVATTESTGVVKPDGTTITIDEDGTLHGVAKVTVDDALSPTSTNPVQNKVVKGAVDELKQGLGIGSARIDELNQNLGVERARIDSLTKLPEGSTTGDAELQDIRVKADGTTATSAGNAVREQVGELKSDLDKYNRDYKPLVDETINKGGNILSQRFISGNTYTIYNDSSSYSIIPQVKDDDGNNIEYLEQVTPKQTKKVTPTSNGRIGFYTSGSNIRVIVENTNDIYYKFSKPKKTMFTVGDGKDYPNVVSCFKALKDNIDEKTIYIDSGVYDMFAAMGGKNFVDSISSDANWREVNVFVPPNSKVIGIGNVYLDFLPSESDITPEVSRLLSPINVLGNVHLENLIIRGDNCRYCIHDDGSGSDDNANTTKTYKNIRVIKSRTNPNYGYAQGFGGGAFNHMRFNFDECVFETTDDNSFPFSCHDNNNSLTRYADGYVMYIKNCAFISKVNKSLRFGNVSWRDIPNNIFIFNSYLSHKIEIVREMSAGKQVANITMVRCNNVDITYDLKDGDENQYPAKIYN